MYLDKIKKIEYDEKNPKVLNDHALSMLPTGIFSIAKSLRDYEIKILMTTDAPVLSADFRDREDIDLIYNNYHWFVMTSTNYIRLVGLYDYLNNNNIDYHSILDKEHFREVKKHCDMYLNEVAPEMSIWRNKVYAHFSITYPFKDDNMAVLLQSVFNSVAYKRPYFTIGSLNIGYTGGTADLPEFSLTQEYEKLQIRYWEDDMKINSIGSPKINHVKANKNTKDKKPNLRVIK